MFSRSLITATLKPISLSVLSEGEVYGYQLIERVKKISGGKISLTTGTLYPFLHRLEADGLVISTWKEVPDAPRRKYYSLTRKGRKALVREQRQWMDAHQILERLWGHSALIPSVEPTTR